MTETALNKAPIGKALRIVGINGGRAARLRLATLGLREGTSISVAHADGGGPVVIEVGGGRLVLGAGMADKIIVS